MRMSARPPLKLTTQLARMLLDPPGVIFQSSLTVPPMNPGITKTKIRVRRTS